MALRMIALTWKRIFYCEQTHILPLWAGFQPPVDSQGHGTKLPAAAAPSVKQESVPQSVQQHWMALKHKHKTVSSCNWTMNQYHRRCMIALTHVKNISIAVYHHVINVVMLPSWQRYWRWSNFTVQVNQIACNTIWKMKLSISRSIGNNHSHPPPLWHTYSNTTKKSYTYTAILMWLWNGKAAGACSWPLTSI
jgi:hypothetical protein